jgi:hypothetical protein
MLDREWAQFKYLSFVGGMLCYFCLVPFGPPFHHQRASRGSKQTPDLCAYPDALKELAFIIYKDQTIREKVFAELGVPAPSSLHGYKQCLTAAQARQLPALYKIIDAYLSVREDDAALA